MFVLWRWLGSRNMAILIGRAPIVSIQLWCFGCVALAVSVNLTKERIAYYLGPWIQYDPVEKQ